MLTQTTCEILLVIFGLGDLISFVCLFTSAGDYANRPTNPLDPATEKWHLKNDTKVGCSLILFLFCILVGGVLMMYTNIHYPISL